jgi:pimeloyl-ACP methyl ester carboxylesterase
MVISNESTPGVDELRFSDLYEKEEYPVETEDGWRLIVTRYKPVRQTFKQPLFGQPILMVHGFTQNRHTWSAGEFVKNLLYFGVDVHILELRGHGKSSIRLQEELLAKEDRPLPEDINFDWDIDSYFLFDVPAAIKAVKEKTKQAKIFYCGHSMGGMIAYGYAGLHDDLRGLITVGSPSDLGRGFWPLKLVAHLDAATPVLLAELKAVNLARKAAFKLGAVVEKALGTAEKGVERKPPEDWEVRHLPFDYLLRTWGKIFTPMGGRGLERMNQRFPFLYNPKRVVPENILWLLTWGGEKEPLAVTRQFARWIRSNELKCYRINYDFKANFPKITLPIAIIFGDEDRLANIHSTRSVYRNVSSEYLLWRPVRGNSHMELTMGHDIRQICYDIKNLMEYALSHEDKRPSLPRRDLGDSVRIDSASRKARRLRIVK